MKFLIRPMNWNDIKSNGIPRDAFGVMQYFNEAISKNLYPFIPRKKKITFEEILNLWAPSKDKNISIVAQRLDGKIVGCGTILIQGNDNQYSKDSSRETGEYTLTIDPTYFDYNLEEIITKNIIE